MFPPSASAKLQNNSSCNFGAEAICRFQNCARVIAGTPMTMMTSKTQLTHLIKNRCTKTRGDFYAVQLIFSAILYLNIRFFIQRTASKS